MTSPPSAPPSLRRSLFFAITLTNTIGMPALAVYIFAVLGVIKKWRFLRADFAIDPLFAPLVFCLLLFVSFSFIFIHYFHVIRLIQPGHDFLRYDPRRDKRNKRELARQALKASEWFPYHTCYWSIFYYVIGTPIALGIINLPYSFSSRQLLSLYFGILITGILISIFQFYRSRRVLSLLQERILSEFPDFLLEEDISRRSTLELGLKPKFMAAIVTLAALMIILTSAAALNFALRSLQIQTGEIYRDQLSRRLAEIEIKTNTETPPAELYQLIQGMALESTDILLLLDENQQYFFRSALDPRFQRLAELLLKPGSWELFKHDPTIQVLREGIYSVVLGLRHHYVVVSLPFTLKPAYSPEGTPQDTPRSLNLLVLISDIRYQDALRGMDLMILMVMVVGIALALYYAKVSSEELRDPLRLLMNNLQALAHGDLTQKVLVTSRDELGIVAHSLARAFFGLRRLISKVGEAAEAVENSAAVMARQAEEVATGSSAQAREVHQTSQAMEEMRASVAGIADSMQTLAASTEESSASIVEVQATIDHVAANVESLSRHVLDTTAAIEEMSTSIAQVADNVQNLTRRSEEAINALLELERMIEKVTEGSQKTAGLTAEVANNAQTGAEAVQLTIRGIDKIQETSRSVAAVIATLGERAKEIGNILNVITDVTEETNLLALNAAIIAAQAGEHGRGFAVVADEIKDLAERTAASTKEIEVLIQSVQQDAAAAVERTYTGLATITEGVRLAGDAGDALRLIQTSVAKALSHTQEIAAAVSVQIQKAKQLMEFMEGVNALITQIATATQEQRKSGRQILIAAEEMKNISQQVKRATAEQSQGSRQITRAIEHIAEITNYINTAQSDQLKETENVNLAIHRIKEVADQNQDRVTTMTASVRELKALAAEIKTLIQEFRL